MEKLNVNMLISKHILLSFWELVCSLVWGHDISFLYPGMPGQPRRHLLQSGWSVFVSSKRLVAGDAFIFLRFDALLQMSQAIFVKLCTILKMSNELAEARMESCELE